MKKQPKKYILYIWEDKSKHKSKNEKFLKIWISRTKKYNNWNEKYTGLDQ